MLITRPLPGQRPLDTPGYDESDIKHNVLFIGQGKTGKKLWMEAVGEIKVVIERIRARKAAYKVAGTALVVTGTSLRMTRQTLQYRFRTERDATGIPAKDFPVPESAHQGRDG
jgi:hypothetical protein